MPDAPGPSWKHSGGQAARPATSRKAWQPGRSQPTRGPVDPRKKYRRRLILAGGSGALLVGLVVAVILLWDPFRKPTLIVIAPDVPDSTVVPANPASILTATRLVEFAADRRRGARKFEVYADPGPATAAWYSHIDDGSGPLVLHFACPGSGDKGGPFLWLVPADATVAEPGHRLLITSVLTRLEKLPPERPKLLILDAATEPASWPRGQLHNDFARRLRALDADIKNVANLVIICSADEDQRSWVSEEWQQTAFGHFLNEGLRGAAAAPNDRITARDLFAYVDKAVRKWAQSNRHARQVPILLPSVDTTDPSRDGPTRAGGIILTYAGTENYTPIARVSAPGYRFTVPAQLRLAWDRCERIKTMSPAPETKAPHVWRQYLDLLLRAEQTARVTGDVPPNVILKLKTLGDQLEAPLWGPTPPCVPFSLPAGKSLGYQRTALTPRQFQTLWEHEKPADAWDELSRNGDADRMRLAVADAIVQHLLIGPAPDRATLNRAEEILKVVEVGKSRPVETHLLRTFIEHLAAGRDPALVRLALKVQVAAERAAWFTGPDSAYPYAEQVALWLRQDLGAADQRRLDGTDLVFGGDAASATAARGFLEPANAQYDDLGRKAVDLGRAYRLRDLILTRLPYYARWAASLRQPDEKVNPLLERIEDAAGKAHVLADLLDAPAPDKLAAVFGLVKDLDGSQEAPGLFRKLEADFLAPLSRMPDQAVPGDWFALDSALAVPFIPIRTRMEMLGKLRSVSQRLHDFADPQDDAKPDEPVSAREFAQRQGRMALAMLGEPRVNDLQGKPSIPWARLQERMRSDIGPWWDLLADAGERIGAIFVALPREAGQSADTGARAEPGQAEVALTRAARLARLVDGATILSSVNPAALERQLWTHNLLIAQAARAARAGWADLGGGADPYCLRAANAYLTSATAILFGTASVPDAERLRRSKPVEEARAALHYPTFELTADPIWLTDRQYEPLRYGIWPKDGPTGYPVLRVADVTPPVDLRDFPRKEYRPVNEFAAPRVEAATGSIDLAAVNAGKALTGRVDLQLLYRGRLVQRKVDVAQAETSYHWIYHKSDAKASIAVKGDAALRSGAVAIMVDMSDSMNEDKRDGQVKTRKVRAAEALELMLMKLPEDTQVSVSFFAGGSGRIETFFPPRPWDQPVVRAKALADKVKNTTADGQETPLAESIVKALSSDDLFPKDFKGFRSLIVITDGSDTKINPLGTSPTPATTEPGEVVLKQLNAAAKANGPERDITLHLVLFGGDKVDSPRAYKQFGAIADPASYTDKERSTAHIWPSMEEYERGIKLVEPEALAERLKEAMLPRTVVRSFDRKFEKRLPTSIGTDQTIRWLEPTVEPGTYHLTALGRTQDVEVRAGELFLLDLQMDGGRSKFVLPKWAPTYGLTGAPREPSTDRTVHLTVLGNSLTQQSNTYDLELAATLEKPIVDGPDVLFRQLPRFAWFEVGAADADKGKAPAAIRVEYIHRQMAPAWKINASRWVPRAGQTEVALAPARAQLNAYWLDSEPQGGNNLDFARLTDKDLKPTVDGVKVTVDPDITLKDGHLTLRLTHEPNKRVLVRVALQGASKRWTLNEEHKFFDTANKYTAVFWPIQEKDLPGLTFEFFSMDALKQRAKMIPMELKQPPKLDARDQLPQLNLRD